MTVLGPLLFNVPSGVTQRRCFEHSTVLVPRIWPGIQKGESAYDLQDRDAPL
jgi:hypothetical protein